MDWLASISVTGVIAFVAVLLVLWFIMRLSSPVTSHFEIMRIIEEDKVFERFRASQKIAQRYNINPDEFEALLQKMLKNGIFEVRTKTVPSLGPVKFYRYKRV